jgi:hypothetical protein
VWLIADETGTGVDLATLSQYGVLGVFAVLLVLFARLAYRRETDRSDRLEAEVFRLNNIIQERVIPALQSATRTVEESQALLSSMQREREYALQRRTRRDGDEP